MPQVVVIVETGLRKSGVADARVFPIRAFGVGDRSRFSYHTALGDPACDLPSTAWDVGPSAHAPTLSVTGPPMHVLPPAKGPSDSSSLVSFFRRHLRIPPIVVMGLPRRVVVNAVFLIHLGEVENPADISVVMASDDLHSAAWVPRSSVPSSALSCFSQLDERQSKIRYSIFLRLY